MRSKQVSSLETILLHGSPGSKIVKKKTKKLTKTKYKGVPKT